MSADLLADHQQHEEHTLRWTCNLCGVTCDGKMSEAFHRKNYFKSDDDPTRCDNVIGAQRKGIPRTSFNGTSFNDEDPTRCSPFSYTSIDPESAAGDSDLGDSDSPELNPCDATVTVPFKTHNDNYSLAHLARRPAVTLQNQRLKRH